VQGSTGISTFQKSFPDRYIEVGVAEANMISTGAGFSKAGFIPIVDTFGQFGVTKGNLPLTMARATSITRQLQWLGSGWLQTRWRECQPARASNN